LKQRAHQRGVVVVVMVPPFSTGYLVLAVAVATIRMRQGLYAIKTFGRNKAKVSNTYIGNMVTQKSLKKLVSLHKNVSIRDF